MKKSSAESGRSGAPGRWLVVASTVGLGLAGAVTGCSSNSVPGGAGGRPGGSDTGGLANGSGGATNTGGQTGSGGGGAGSGGRPGSGGSQMAGSSGGAPGGGQGGSALAGGPATGGQSGGAAGGPTGGIGGSSSGGVECPAGAFFCSGFEEAGLPTGAVYRVNAAPGDWSRDYELDTTLHNQGKASLRVKSSTEAGTSGSAYKMLSVPASATFWVRFYLRSDLDIGGVDHNAFAEASGSDDPNDGVAVELAEDVGIAFNSKDDVRWPTGYGRLMTGATNPYSLPKNTWHCIEISYDSQAREQKLFINGTPQIDATNYPAAFQPAGTSFKVFKFGFQELHGPPRKLWYDDVAVASQRINCL